jgi:hypothetical protein
MRSDPYFLFHGSFARHCVLVAASVKVFMLNPVGLVGGAMAGEDQLWDASTKRKERRSCIEAPKPAGFA